MINEAIFFGSELNSGNGGLPPMPENVAHPMREGGNLMPAEKLFSVQSMDADSGTVTVVMTGNHFLTAVGTGTIRISGANESQFNGKYTYVVVNTTTLEFTIDNQSNVTATGTLSVCCDFFNGEYYELPRHSASKFFGPSSNFKNNAHISRYTKTGSQIWDVEIPDLALPLLGVSMLTNGNLAYAFCMKIGTGDPVEMHVHEIDKASGAVTEISLVLSVSFENQSWPDSPSELTIKWLSSNDVNIPYQIVTFPDLSRSFFSASEDGTFSVSGPVFANDGDSFATVDNLLVSFDSNSIINTDLLRLPSASTRVAFPTQYISKDGSVFVGKIVNRVDPWDGSNPTRSFFICRGQGVARIDIPNDSNSHFRIDRTNEKNAEYNYWIQSIIGCTEPIKINIMDDYIFISPVALGDPATSIRRTSITGSKFMLRKEFDAWLNLVCDKAGLKV